MSNNILFYCVGFISKECNPETNYKDYFTGNLWKCESDKKYFSIIKAVKVSSLIAARTTFTKVVNNNKVSVTVLSLLHKN